MEKEEFTISSLPGLKLKNNFVEYCKEVFVKARKELDELYEAEGEDPFKFIEKVDIKKIKRVTLKTIRRLRVAADTDSYWESPEQQNFFNVSFEITEEVARKTTTATWRLIQAVAPVIEMIIVEATKKGGIVEIAMKLVKKIETMDLPHPEGDLEAAMSYFGKILGKEEAPTEETVEA